VPLLECHEASKLLLEFGFFPTGSINLGFLLRENLLLCSSYLPLGVPNWTVIYINTVPHHPSLQISPGSHLTKFNPSQESVQISKTDLSVCAYGFRGQAPPSGDDPHQQQ
jgi:hypothetical protein